MGLIEPIHAKTIWALVGSNIHDIFFNIDFDKMIVWRLISIPLYDIYEFVLSS